jgi:cytochrome P450
MMGHNHYMVVMPSLTKQYYLQRPNVMTSDDFMTWILDKYFGDGGESRRMPSEDFHIVHRTLNSLMKDPFLSNATGRITELVQEHTHKLLSYSADPAKQQHWERIARAVPTGESMEADLFHLTMNFVGDVSGEVLMGKAIFENHPTVLDDLWIFDNAFNAFLSGMPPITRKVSEARAARTRLITAFDDWNRALVKSMRGEDPGHSWRDMSDVSETMKLRCKALEGINTSDAYNAANNLAVYWGLMVNANKVTFWMLLHIISSPPLLRTIRDEISAFAISHASTPKDQGTLSIDATRLAKSCPNLKATFFETMRLYTAGTSYKKVLQPLSLTESPEDAAALGKPRPQTYHIRKGDFLVIPHATMQMDPRLWKDPAKFDHTRFLVRDEKAEGGLKADIGNLNAFGGGHSVCKGRHFAEREVLIFVAGFVQVWEWEPMGSEGWRMPGKVYNGTGSANPVGSVRVKVRRRI